MKLLTAIASVVLIIAGPGASQFGQAAQSRDELGFGPNSQNGISHGYSMWDYVEEMPTQLDQQAIERLRLSSQAHELSRQGRYAEAEQLLKRSLKLTEIDLGPNHPAFATALSDLAWLYIEEDRYDEAELLLKRSLVIFEFGQELPDKAWALNNLATLYVKQGRYADAEQLFKRSKDVLEKLFGPGHPSVATVLNNLGELYRRQDRYEEAEPFYKQSLAIMKAQGSADAMYPLANLAVIYVKQRRYADAEAAVKGSLASAEKVFDSNHPWIGLLRNGLAWLYAKQDRYEDALAVGGRSIDEKTAAPYAAFRVLKGAERLKLISESESFADSYKVLQSSSFSAAADAVQKVAQRIAAGSGPLADIVRKDQDLAAEADRLDKALTAVLGKDPEERDKAAEDSQRKRLVDIASERGKLLKVLEEQFPDYVALTNPPPLTLEETQKLLSDDEAVIVFDFPTWPNKISIRENGYAWVVTNNAADWVELPGNAEDLALEIKKLRLSLTFALDAPFDVALAHRIYQETFGPIDEKLKGKTRMSVVASGPLTSIPSTMLEHSSVHPGQIPSTKSQGSPL